MNPTRLRAICGLLLFQVVFTCAFSGFLVCYTAEAGMILELACLPCDGGNRNSSVPSSETRPDNCSRAQVEFCARFTPGKSGVGLGRNMLPSLWHSYATIAQTSLRPEQARFLSVLATRELSTLRTTVLVV